MMYRCLIANRGEIAVRIIRACRELNIETVAIYAKGDENSLHVSLADQAICIGEANPLDSYLNIDRIISAAKVTESNVITLAMVSYRNLRILRKPLKTIIYILLDLVRQLWK